MENPALLVSCFCMILWLIQIAIWHQKLDEPGGKTAKEWRELYEQMQSTARELAEINNDLFDDCVMMEKQHLSDQKTITQLALENDRLHRLLEANGIHDEN